MGKPSKKYRAGLHNLYHMRQQREGQELCGPPRPSTSVPVYARMGALGTVTGRLSSFVGAPQSPAPNAPSTGLERVDRCLRETTTYMQQAALAQSIFREHVRGRVSMSMDRQALHRAFYGRPEPDDPRTAVTTPEVRARAASGSNLVNYDFARAEDRIALAFLSGENTPTSRLAAARAAGVNLEVRRVGPVFSEELNLLIEEQLRRVQRRASGFFRALSAPKPTPVADKDLPQVRGRVPRTLFGSEVGRKVENGKVKVGVIKKEHDK